MPELEFPVTEEEYQRAGSKFITFPPEAKVGDVQFRAVEVEMIDWDTPGKSMKCPVKVTEEGIDFGKKEKISFGVDEKGVWKAKEIYLAVTGQNIPMRQGADGRKHPYIDPMALVGKAAVGCWTMQKGYKGGDPTQGETTYPKLISLHPAGYKPMVSGLGI